MDTFNLDGITNGESAGKALKIVIDRLSDLKLKSYDEFVATALREFIIYTKNSNKPIIFITNPKIDVNDIFVKNILQIASSCYNKKIYRKKLFVNKAIREFSYAGKNKGIDLQTNNFIQMICDRINIPYNEVFIEHLVKEYYG